MESSFSLVNEIAEIINDSDSDLGSETEVSSDSDSCDSDSFSSTDGYYEDSDNESQTFSSAPWKNGNFKPKKWHFNVDAGINPEICLDGENPLDYFTYFFDINLVDYIVGQTNLYQHQNAKPSASKTASWYSTSKEEMYVFLATTMLMAINSKPRIKNYWSTDQLLSTPIFAKIFTRNRYISILKCLHFSNNEEIEEIEQNRLRKVIKVIEMLKAKFTSALTPFQNLCIDESLMLWKGRLSFRQYIPSKRNRLGIKLFMLCDCETRYLLDLLVYAGSQTDITLSPGLGVSGSIVQKLISNYLGQERILFVDNWYTSPSLFMYLFKNNTGACGTARKNLKSYPSLSGRIPKGEMIYQHNNYLLALKWKDKREVYMLSSAHTPEMVESRKLDSRTKRPIMIPKCVSDYNLNMGAVDKVDMQISFSECLRKTTKWYKKLFFHFLDFQFIMPMYYIK